MEIGNKKLRVISGLFIFTVTKPKYQGPYPQNRFGIPPGHRWDGVDRSNGYEERWFRKQNDRKAKEEEAYKWGVEDM